MELLPSELQFLEEFTNFLVPILQKESETIYTKYFDKDYSINYKPGDDIRQRLDVVTKIDEIVEQDIYEALHKKFPDLGFDLEEHKDYKDKDKEFICYLDPIDGTKYFSRQIPLFSTQAALCLRGEPIMGVVINPISKEIHIGSALSPTTRNGIKVRVSDVDDIGKAYINVGNVPFRPYWDNEKEWIYDKLKLFKEKASIVRTLGSSGLVLSWVSHGGFDGSIYLTVDPDYDTNAGVALVKYAGGSYRKVKVKGIVEPRLIVGNKRLLDQFEELLLV